MSTGVEKKREAMVEVIEAAAIEARTNKSGAWMIWSCRGGLDMAYVIPPLRPAPMN